MWIYIHNMEMPKEKYGVSCVIYPDGKVCFTNGKEYHAVTVPPFGKLIDADALNEDIARMVPWSITDPTEEAFLDGLSAAYEAIQASPTIIPAEEGE